MLNVGRQTMHTAVTVVADFECSSNTSTRPQYVVFIVPSLRCRLLHRHTRAFVDCTEEVSPYRSPVLVQGTLLNGSRFSSIVSH